MFDKIKGSIEKFSSRNVADKEAVKELVKDIQRDLIRADVDVGLVSDLTDEIKEEALKEDLPSGLSRKEHVLKIVYDKLEELLGEEAEIEVEPKNILLCGLYGAGKCVAPNTIVQISDGSRVEAEELYSKLNDGCVEEVEDGERFKVDDLRVPSFNPETLEIEDKEVEYIWKLEKDDDLVNVELEAGDEHEVQVTPEHPFFVLDEGEVVKKRADQLNESDFVAVPREMSVGEGSDIQKILYEYLGEDYHFKDEELSNKVKEKIKMEYGTLEKGFNSIDLSFNYPWFTKLLSSKNEVPKTVYNHLDMSKENIPQKVVHKNSNSAPFELPENNSAFLEFLGYLMADGYISEGYLELNSGDKDIIERWEHLAKSIFGLEATTKKDERSEELYYSRIASSSLAKLICKLLDSEPGAKSGEIKLPNELLKLESQDFEGFIQAYFDCDGHAHEGRHIEITSKSEEMISQLRTLLLRNEVFSSVSSKYLEGEKYYRLKISGKSATTFAEKISSRIERKEERLKEYADIQKFQGSGSEDMIPVEGELQRQRLKTHTSISELQEEVNSYGRYEKKGSISREALKNSLKVMKTQSRAEKVLEVADGKKREQIIQEINIGHSELTGTIKGLEKQEKIVKREDETYEATYEQNEDNLNPLERLSESDVNWVKISKTERTQKHEYVYDLTVKDNHSFIAENTIIHNTTTAGKLADYYRKRGMKVGLIAADTDRPAAYNQLKQISEDVEAEFHGDPDAEVPVKVVEEGMEKLDTDVTIVDSAGRDSLNDRLKKQLSDMSDAFQPEEKYLVIPADIGQSDREQAEMFHESVGITGVMVTKMDSSAKGGGALVACADSEAKVQFIGTGEKMGDLEEYDPVDFVSDMIGQPDLESLLEKIEEMDTNPEELLEGEFTMQDFKEQIESVTQAGVMEEMMQQLPFSSNKLPDNMQDMTEGKIENYTVIMDSMTDEEMQDPSIIKGSRRERIAKGSATDKSEVGELVKHFKQTKNMMNKFDKSSMKRGNMKDMMSKMGL